MNGTIAWITARGLFGRRRFLLLLPLPILLIGLAVIGRATGVDPDHWGAAVILGMGFAVVLPVVSLIVGTGVLGSEIDDGTVVHILAKPLARREIIFSKLLVAVGVTATTVAIPMYVAGVLAHSVRFGLALVAASAIGAAAYCALFLALSLVTRRPVLLGLVYVLVWEGLLGNVVRGTRVLSIQQYVVTVADEIAPTAMLTGRVSVTLAAVMSALFFVAGTALAVNRLRSFSVAGETS
jgi:ABC-2 type transport system permease protein